MQSIPNDTAHSTYNSRQYIIIVFKKHLTRMLLTMLCVTPEENWANYTHHTVVVGVFHFRQRSSISRRNR